MDLVFITLTFDFIDGTWANYKCWNPDDGIPFNQSKPFLEHNISEVDSETAVEQFWKWVRQHYLGAAWHWDLVQLSYIELSNHLSQPNRTIKIQARRWLWYWPMATWLWPNLSLLSQQRGAPHEWWDRGGWICPVGSPWIPHPCMDSGLLCHLEGTTQFWKGTTVTTLTINFAQHKAQELCNNILTHILDVYISQFLCCNLMTRKSKQ